jgi:hypothetical protein
VLIRRPVVDQYLSPVIGGADRALNFRGQGTHLTGSGRDCAVRHRKRAESQHQKQGQLE